MTEEQIKIRIFATPTDQSQEYYYVKGFLVISIDAPSGWAFADHLKYQGGGNQGEYTEVLEWKEPADTGEEEGYWDIRAKDFFGVDNSDDELGDGVVYPQRLELGVREPDGGLYLRFRRAGDGEDRKGQQRPYYQR